MRHYRNLAKANYDRYISINRFDVARAASPFDDLGASPRYRYSPIGEGVRLLIAKGSRLWSASARVTEVGESGALLRLVDPEYQDGLEAVKVRAGDFASLRFLESGRVADGRIVEVDLTATPPLIEVQFTALVSLADFAFSDALPSSELALRLRAVDDAGSPTTDQLSRRLFYLFEVVDEVRYIANYANDRMGATLGYSSPATVERLTVASPAEMVLTVSELVQSLWPAGAISAALAAAFKIPEKRKTWLEGTAIALENDAKRAASEDRRLQRERDAAIRDLATAIVDRLQGRGDVSSELSVELVALAVNRLGPLLESLADAGVTAVEGSESPLDE